MGFRLFSGWDLFVTCGVTFKDDALMWFVMDSESFLGMFSEKGLLVVVGLKFMDESIDRSEAG